MGDGIMKMISSDSNKVLVLRLDEDYVNGLLINHDLTDDGDYSFMEDTFVEIVMNYLPEYAMGYDFDSMTPLQIVPILREVAKSVIKIKKIDKIKQYLDSETPYKQWDSDILKTYNSKGIFSELILHFILREIKGTIPLISKIYFKDTNAIEAHGFDAVHITDKKLWLGETKFYTDGKQGIRELIEDLNKHFNHDYLKEQFVIIKRAIIKNELRDEWIEKLSNATKLEEKIDMIIAPLLCIYNDQVASEIISAINEKRDSDTIFFNHIDEMKKYFEENNDFKNRDKLKTLLILLPVESKDRIVAAMLSKIYNMQNI